MTDDEITIQKQQIDAMDRLEMASLWRFAPAGHPYFDKRLPLYEYFKSGFDALGGFSPGIRA